MERFNMSLESNGPEKKDKKGTDENELIYVSGERIYPDGEPEKDNKKEGEKEIDYAESKVSFSEAEIQERINEFLNRPENKGLGITKKTARQAVEAELRRANEKIKKWAKGN